MSLFRSDHKKRTLVYYTFQGVLFHYILLQNRIKKFQAISQNVTVEITILFLFKSRYFSVFSLSGEKLLDSSAVQKSVSDKF